MDWLSVKCTLGKNCQMFVSMRAKKNSAGIKLQYFCQYGDRKKNNQRTKFSIYILDTIESESTTRFKNRSSDRMMTSDWLVDVSDDRYTTNAVYVCCVIFVLSINMIINIFNFVNYNRGCTQLAAASDKAYQLLAHGQWFSPGTKASSSIKTGQILVRT